MLFVVNHVGVKMAESFAANAERDFVLQKPGKKLRIKVAEREYSKVNCLQNQMGDLNFSRMAD